MAAPGAHLRPVQPRDHCDLLTLNATHVPAVSAMDEERLLWLLTMTDRADVVDVDGEFAGFVFTFPPGTAYDSANYRWFGDRFGSDFYYLDRIVVADSHQRRGLGRFVYDEMERVAAPYGRLALEVNTVPPNQASLAFHGSRGYAGVGTRSGEDWEVLMMTRELDPMGR